LSNDWQYRPIDWGEGQTSDSGNSLGNQPTQVSANNSNDYQVYQTGEPGAPPPPPDPSAYPFDNPYSNYGANTEFSQPPPFGTPVQVGTWRAQPFPGAAPSRPRRVIFMPLFILLLLVACSGGFAFFAYKTFTGHGLNITSDVGGSGDQANNGVNGPLTVSTGAHPAIIIDRNAGALHIIGIQGATQIVVQAKGTSYSDEPITYTKSSDGQSFTFDLDGVEALEVDLNVPATSDLNLTTNGDDITVENVTGQVMLDSNAGALKASQMSLTGISTLKTNAGDITFSGSLATDGTYTFDTNGGNVSVTLPAAASFHVDMSTNGGTLHSDFSQVTLSDSEGHGDVGQAPFAKVTMSSNGGNVTLLKG
jgi:hypothetical protein